MTLPSNPPATTTPAAFKTWAQNVVDTLTSHDTDLATKQDLHAALTDLTARWIVASASAPASLAFLEDTDNGSNKATITAPSALGADRTITLPDATGTVALIDTSAYDATTWNGSQKAPTQDAVRDKIETLGGGGGITLQTATVATSQTTTSTSYTDLATSGPAVTVTTGTSALVFIAGNLSNNTDASLMSAAVSGASTVAAADTAAIRHGGASVQNGDAEFGTHFVLSGLTPGSNTFTAKYRVNAGTGTFYNRRITVIAL